MNPTRVQRRNLHLQPSGLGGEDVNLNCSPGRATSCAWSTFRRSCSTPRSRECGRGLEKQIVRVERASATDLDCFQDGAFGAVLTLGPLYHLLTPDERRRAVGEAERVLKPSGVLFASGINRLAYK